MFRSTSPLLAGTSAEILHECPVSLVLRGAPHVYEALGAASHIENGAIDPLTISAWGREAVRVVSSERARHVELRERERKSKEVGRGG